MTTRTERWAWVGCLLAAVAIGALPGFAWAEPQVIEAAVRVRPAKQASLYLRFRNNKLWMATSKAALGKKTPIRAANADLSREGAVEHRSYDFPRANLPLSLHGIEKIQAAFYSSRRIGKGNAARGSRPEDRTRVVAMFRISRRDSSGAAWAYTVHSAADSDTAKLAGQPLELTLPQLDPDHFTLKVETKVEKGNAGIGLQVKSGDVDIGDVLKGKANAPATVEIVDLQGRTVASKKGDLQTFGFT